MSEKLKYDPYTEFTRHVLQNGLEVHCVSKGVSWVHLEVVVHCGGREDPVELPGLAHFVEHVVSPNIPGYDISEVNSFFDTCGGRGAYGSTSYLSTRYRFSVPADVNIFSEALKIFGAMLLGARINNHVERERSVIIREFNGRYPFPEKLVWDMDMQKAVFRGHRLESWNRPSGRFEGIYSIQQDDLQEFYNKYYVPNNMSLVVIGGLSSEEMITAFERSPFGTKKDGVRNPIPQPFGQIPILTEEPRIVNLSDYVGFKVPQTEYRATWAFPMDFPWQALRVFDQMLSEALFNEIRQKRGLAYSISSNYCGYHDVYEYWISAQVDPNATSYIDELVQNCISMVPSMHNLFNQKLARCKYMCNMCDLSGHALAVNSAGDLVTHQRIIPMQEVWNDLHRVTFGQMADAAALLSQDQKYTFIAHP